MAYAKKETDSRDTVPFRMLVQLAEQNMKKTSL